MVKIGIFYNSTTKEKAENLFNNIVEQFDPDKIKIVRMKNESSMKSEYFYIQLISMSSSSKGRKWDKAYIPQEITNEDIWKIIRPQCISIPQQF